MVNLTSSEKKTIIFTTVILIISGLFQWIQPNKVKEHSFDYSKSDSVFNRLSRESNSKLKENQVPSGDSRKPENIRSSI